MKIKWKAVAEETTPCNAEAKNAEHIIFKPIACEHSSSRGYKNFFEQELRFSILVTKLCVADVL